MTKDQKELCDKLLMSYNKYGFNWNTIYLKKIKELELQNKHLKEQVNELVEQGFELRNLLVDLKKDSK